VTDTDTDTDTPTTPSAVMVDAATLIRGELDSRALTQKQFAARLGWSTARVRAGLVRTEPPARLATLETMLGALGLRARVVVEPLPPEATR